MPFTGTTRDGEKGRCLSCGFLARETLDGPFSEVDWAERRLGMVVADDDPDSTDVSERDVSELRTVHPYCFRGHTDLFMEAFDEHWDGEKSTVRKSFRDALVSVIYKDRKCPKWFPYQPGRAPDAHYQELRMLELEESRRQFEETMEQRRRDWEDRRDEERRKFEERMDAKAEEREGERHAWGMWLALAAIFLATVEVAGTLLGLPVVTRFLGLD